jgi:hypothetical protein
VSQRAATAAAQRTEAGARAGAHEAATTRQIEQREGRATSIAADLAAWAAGHRAARIKAIEQTRMPYDDRGTS